MTWSLPITSLCCGLPVEHVTGTSNGVLAVTIVRCPCHREYELTTRMRLFVRESNRGKARSAA